LHTEQLLALAEQIKRLSDDDFWFFRQFYMDVWYDLAYLDIDGFIGELKRLTKDPHPSIRSDALAYLALIDAPSHTKYFQQAIHDSSAMVMSVALFGLLESDQLEASTLLQFELSTNPEVVLILADVYAGNFEADRLNWFLSKLPYLSPRYLQHFLPLMGQVVFQADEKTQSQVAEVLLYYVRNHRSGWLRLTAYNTLDFLAQLPNREALKEQLKSAEKDPSIKAKM
jgi:aminopeptidase N